MDTENRNYIIYGMHPVTEAVVSGKQIDKVLLKQGLEGVQFRSLLQLLKDRNVHFQFDPAERLARVGNGRNQ